MSLEQCPRKQQKKDNKLITFNWKKVFKCLEEDKTISFFSLTFSEQKSILRVFLGWVALGELFIGHIAGYSFV